MAVGVVACLTGAWIWRVRATAAPPEVAAKPVTDVRRFRPRPISRTPARIPDHLRPTDRDAKITARILIRPDGGVAQVEIVESDLPDANVFIVDAVTRWRFEPSGIEQESMYHKLIPRRVQTPR